MTATTSDQERDPGSLGARPHRHLEDRPVSLLLPLRSGPPLLPVTPGLLQRILPEAEEAVPPDGCSTGQPANDFRGGHDGD